MTLSAIDIQQTRDRLGLTQAQFGQLLGVHWVTVSKWERGVLRPSPYQAGMILEFREGAKSKNRDELGQKLGQMLIVAGVLAAVFFLLKAALDSRKK